MIGQNTGHIVYAKETGFLLMGPSNPIIPPTQKESYILSAHNPEKEKSANEASVGWAEKAFAEKQLRPLEVTI